MSEWPRFRRQQAAEREQLRRLLATMQPLLDKCRASPPTDIELSALAAMLHSFYTGVENILKRVAVEIDRQPVRGELWHRDLLNRMTRPGPARPALLPDDLCQALGDYLAFRHVFRNAYSFDLQWEKMSALVLDVSATLARVEAAIDTFLQRVDAGGSGAASH